MLNRDIITPVIVEDTDGSVFLETSLSKEALPSAYTYTRSGSATDLIDNVLVLFSADTPRISRSNGLLIEESRTNSALNSTVTLTNCSSTASQLDIMGTTTAYKVTAASGTSVKKDLVASGTPTAGSYYSVSRFLKPVTHSLLQLYATSSGGIDAYVNFSLTGEGSITSSGTGVQNEKITKIGDTGWYLVQFSFLAFGTPVSGNTVYFLKSGIETGAPSVTCSGTEAYITCCAQHEAGFGSTSYIPTTTSTATRGASTVTRTTSIDSIPSPFSVTVDFVPKFIPVTDAAYTSVLRFDDTTANNRIDIGVNTVNKVGNLTVTAGGALQFSSEPSATSFKDYELSRVCARVKTNDFYTVVFQRTKANSSGTVPAFTTLTLGATGFNGYIKNFTIYNVEKSNVDLVSLSQFNYPATPPMRVAEIYGKLPENRLTVGSSYDTAVFRSLHIIGDDYTDLAISLSNFYLQYSSETRTGNTITLLSLSAETNGIVKPVYFGSSRSLALLDGDYDKQSVTLVPSDFGLSLFTEGTTIWLKGVVSLSSASHYLPIVYSVIPSDFSNQSEWYNSSTSTVSSTDVTGDYTVSGGSFSTQAYSFRPLILGHPVRDTKSIVVTADSLSAGNGDSSRGVGGRGWVNVAVYNGGTSMFPCLSLARSGGWVLQSVGSRRIKHFFRYGKYALDECASNDIGSNTSLAVMKLRKLAVWRNLRDAGVSRVIVAKTWCITSSTDSWATLANQTYSTPWSAGGVAELLNAWVDTKKDKGIEKVLEMTQLRSVSDQYKWVVDGTPNYMTTDGSHPTPLGCDLIAPPLRQALEEIVV